MDADFRSLGLAAPINEQLGQRSVNAQYSYADVIKSLAFMFSIGGEVLEDLNIVREQIKDHPSVQICSPDTVEYVCKELQQPTQFITTDKGIIHQLNAHEGFNRLLPQLCIHAGVLAAKQPYTLDYDGHMIENTKADNTFTYKHTQGYYPVVLSIQKLPVFVQNRNGHTPEQYHQLSLIKQTLSRCAQLAITVKKFRSDACCYEKDTVAYLEKNHLTYYIRCEMNASVAIALEDETDWQTVMLGQRKVEVCSIKEPVLDDPQPRRIVAYRYQAHGPLSLPDRAGYRYYAVLTNDTAADALSCIEFYNQRGWEGEHHFKELDYDFGWNHLPFDNFEMNTIYLYLSAIAYLLFNIFKQRYAHKTKWINTAMRLKNFILHFVTLTAKWVKTGRRYILKIFTTKDYPQDAAHTPLWKT